MLPVGLEIGINLRRQGGETHGVNFLIFERTFEYFPIKVFDRQILIDVFQIHLHVIARTETEAKQLIAFRDILRADAKVRDVYVACKREVIASGVTDSLDYCYAKGKFIADVLERAGESSS